MPVLFLDHTAIISGGEIALLRLLARLDRTRYAPAAVLFTEGPLRPALEAIGVPTTVLPLPGGVGDVRKESLGAAGLLSPGRLLASGQFVRRLAAHIRGSGAALVHTNSLKSDVLGGVAARLAGVPLVWHVRDRIADDYLPGPAAAAFRLAMATVPRFVIANSAATLATLGRVAHADPPRARVVHDGTDPDVPLGSPEMADPPVVGMVGRVAPWKGQHVFLDAAAAVRQQFPAARFRIIGAALFGETAYEQQLRDRAARPDLAGAVEFPGFCDDVPRRVAALDVLAHASITGEPFGQVVVEGMAAARPVVATAGGGVPEIIDDNRTGLLVPMNDAAAMAAAIGRLLADPDLRRRLGRAGRERVLAAFTSDHTARGVAAVFDHVLGRTAASV